MFNEACDKHAPIKEKRVSGSLPEWINSDYIKLSKDRDYLFSKTQKTKDPEDWTAAKSLRNRVNNLGRSLKRDYCTKAISDNINDSKKLWSTIKKLIPKQKVSVKNVYNSSNDGFTANDKETANQFNNFFTSIGNSLASKFSDAHSIFTEDRSKSVSFSLIS